MWIVVGTRSKSTPVPGGVRVEHPCDRCRVTTTFVEHETQENLRLYLVDVVGFGAKRVLCCERCGATVVSSAVDAKAARADQAGTLVGHVAGAVERGRRTLASDDVREVAQGAAHGAKQVAGKLEEAAKEVWGDARRRWGSGKKR